MSEHRARAERAEGEAAEAAEEVPMLFLHDVERIYRQGDDSLHVLNGVRAGGLAGADRWRWWRRRAPASRRCCTSPACSSIPTTATSISTAAPPPILPDAERTRIRRQEIGFVYQSHHLLPEFTALENVMLPQMIPGLSRAEAEKRAAELLTYLGLARAADAPAGGALRRRAAARRHRARGRQRAAHPAGRRADRQPRRAHRRTRVRGVHAARARFAACHHHRHPQYGHRRAHGPAGDVAGRAGGGDGVTAIGVALR